MTRRYHHSLFVSLKGQAILQQGNEVSITGKYFVSVVCRYCGDSLESDTFHGEFTVKLLMEIV